ncbi:hypothetical protein USDA257_c60370 [Sinorhizobium fredii USDA 257]|uniref:Uncharacterized protein n=1 Tax=Sinorhizobium fredii (strain USDA 257) TaxID=1185652 RepID=I3XF84_SINF2|nr:hypothetical protein USDA257_c60370 [Sinorhizobium fredii USDA 257]
MSQLDLFGFSGGGQSLSAEPAPLLFKAWVAASLHGLCKKTSKIFQMVKMPPAPC